MAPLNFTHLQSFTDEVSKEDGLNRLEDSVADLWYQQLSEYKLTGNEDAHQMRTIFKASQAIMEYNQTRAAALFDEFEEQARQTGENEDKWQEERAGLKKEVSELRDQLTAGIGHDHEGRTLKAEIVSLREENNELQQQGRERDRELADERDRTEMQMSRIADLEKTRNDESNKIYRLKDTIKELNRRLSALLDSQSGRRGETDATQRKLKERNEAVLRLTTEYQTLSEEYEAQKQDVAQLSASLQEATQEMNQTARKHVQLKEALRSADEAVQSLGEENDRLRKIVEAPEMEKNIFQREVMTSVENKIEQWKTLLHEKDAVIDQCTRKTTALEQQIANLTADSDRASVAVLAKAVQARERHIQVLVEQCDKATDDMNRTTAMIENLQTQMKADGSETMSKQIAEIAKKLHDSNKRSKEAGEKMEEAERAVERRDEQLTGMVARLRKFQQGEYGLEQAVAELNQTRIQLDFRDRQISELTGKCTRLEVELHQLLEQNETASYQDKNGQVERRKKRNRKEGETDRAMNIVLRREIDRLEDERIELKLIMRSWAQPLAQRAVALGLSADDCLLVDQFTNDLKYRKAEAVRKLEPETRTLRPERKSAEDEAQLKTESHSLAIAEADFAQMLGQIRAELPEGVIIPVLDNLLMRFDAIQSSGILPKFPVELVNKLGHMSCRNEQLLDDAQIMRNELQNVKSQFQTANHRIVQLEQSLKDSESTYKAIQLSDCATPTSSLVILNLNEHLLQTLHELSLKTEQLSEVGKVVDSFRDKLSVLKHAHGLLYGDFDSAKKQWADEKMNLERDRQRMSDQLEADRVQIDEFKRLQDTLLSADEEVDRRLGEMSRNLTVMRINETLMTRKYAALEWQTIALDKENDMHKRRLLSVETVGRTHLARLQIRQETTAFELASLHRSLRESVPLIDYQTLNDRFEKMTEKFRPLLEQDAVRMAENLVESKMECALKQLQRSNESLSNALLVEKDKCIRYEVVVRHQSQNQSAQSCPNATCVITSDVDELTKRIATLEVKELKNGHVVQELNHTVELQRAETKKAWDRVDQSERRADQLDVSTAEFQRTEQQLRDELLGCVSENVHLAALNTIVQLQQSEAQLEADLRCQMSLSEVAQSHSDYWQRVDKCKTVELNQLKKCVHDLQAETDHKAVIGRLHLEVIQLKLSETDSHEQLRTIQNQMGVLEGKLLKSEQRSDAKEREKWRICHEQTQKSTQMRRAINSLRTQFSGSVPLQDLEKFHTQLGKLAQDRTRIHEELIRTVETNEQTRRQLEESKLKQSGLEALLSALKDGQGAKKLVEWQDRVEKSTLSEWRSSRIVGKLEAENTHLKQEAVAMESTIAKLEQVNMRFHRDLEHLQWQDEEQIDLGKSDSKIGNIEKVHSIAVKFPENEPFIDDQWLPNPSLSLSEQLEYSLNSLNAMNREMSDLKLLNERLELDNKQATTYINLQTTHPNNNGHLEMDNIDNIELERIRQMAKAVAETFKAQLDQKDMAIEEYQKTIRSMEIRAIEGEKSHQSQLMETRKELEKRTNERLVTMRQFATELGSFPDQGDGNMAENAMLRDSIVELENANSMLTAKLKTVREQLEQEKTVVRRDPQEDMSSNIASPHKSPTIEPLVISESSRSVEAMKAKELLQLKPIKQLVNNDGTLDDFDQQMELFDRSLEHKGRMLQVKVENDHLKRQRTTLNKENKDLRHQLQDLHSKMQQILSDQSNTDIDTLKKQLEIAEKRIKKLKNVKCMENSKGEIDGILARLKKENNEKDQQIDILEHRISTLKDSVRMKIHETENHQLRNNLTLLEKKKNISKRIMPAEKPLENESKQTSDASRWEEKKRFQQQIEKLKEKLRNKSSDFDHQKVIGDRMDRRVKQLEKEKLIEISSKKTVESTIIKLQLENDKLRQKSECQVKEKFETKGDKLDRMPISTVQHEHEHGSEALKLQCGDLAPGLPTADHNAVAIETVDAVRLFDAADTHLESQNTVVSHQLQLRSDSHQIDSSEQLHRLLENDRRLNVHNQLLTRMAERSAPRVVWADDQARMRTKKEADQPARPRSDGVTELELLECKLNADEEMVRTKNEQIRRLEEQLRDEMERNTVLMYENRRLKDKMKAQEWTPTREFDNDKLIRMIRRLKSEVSHLEAETSEFKLKLAPLNRHSAHCLDLKVD